MTDDVIPAIDMWAPIVPARDMMAYVGEHFPLPQLGYLQVFWKGEPSVEWFRELAQRVASDDGDVLASLDAAGITRALITGFDEASTGGTTFVCNEVVAAVAARHPDRFIPFAGADVMRGAAAVREVEHWVRTAGFRGLSLRPFMINLPADDRHYYPFYEKCVELDVPVSVHASANWTRNRSSDLGHPRHFDQVACDFPELKLILSHAGYPWVLEACLLAWKHPNLYLELAAHRSDHDSGQGALRERRVPHRAPAGRAARRVPRPADQARGDGEVAVAQRRAASRPRSSMKNNGGRTRRAALPPGRSAA
jgi:predicted TIM-barrel fold metal-dependent hydrolase